MRIGIKPFRTLKWEYFECSRQQFDKVKSAVGRSTFEEEYPLIKSGMTDITEEMIGRGQPSEVFPEDSQFPELKQLTMKMMREGDEFGDVFNRFALNACKAVMLDEDLAVD